ncbi:MAG: class I mannose-6-phosphate isomerase [Bryobacterales bacterium]|nr:class I mannose-6-phosphate isomerase [Bryobacterales bacterium]MBV9398276.1 class I mannose-6-phosphate isomerase [Bryobacterales bacterium]
MVERLSARLYPKVWGSEVWFEHRDRLPVLIKFITTFDKLSVQVHPDDKYALRHHKCAGKTEMWHILAAHPDARIAAGFRQQLTRPQLRRAALSGEIEELLTWHPARAGDTFFIPAGTVHAIGGGMTLCEIQQYSDITYRLYDYGRGRELHLDHALAVSHGTPHEGPRKSRNGELVCCDYFTTVRKRVKGRARFDPQFNLFVIAGGEGQIAGQDAREGDVLYALPGSGPAAVEGELTVLAVAMKQGGSR